MAVESKRTSAVLWLILLAVGLVSIAPFAWIIIGSFKPHLEIQAGRLYPWQTFVEQPPVEIAAAARAATQSATQPTTQAAAAQEVHLTLTNYRKIFDQLSGLPTYYFNTVYLALAGTFLSLLVGSLAAYGFAQFRFPFSNALFTLLLLTIMIPAEVCLIGRFELMFQLHLYDHITGLLIAYTAGNLLLIVFIMRNVFASIPRDVISAAMIDGAGSWRTFWEVAVPMGRNGLAACGILTFLGVWNEFIFALTFTTMDKVRTLPVGIYLLKNQYGLFNSGVLFATVLMSFLPIVLVFVLLQKYFVKGLSAGALKA